LISYLTPLYTLLFEFACLSYPPARALSRDDVERPTWKDNVESDARLREAAQSANAERRAAMPAMRGGSSVNNDGSGKNNGSETGSTG
jgi:hypothetical protein